MTLAAFLLAAALAPPQAATVDAPAPQEPAAQEPAAQQPAAQEPAPEAKPAETSAPAPSAGAQEYIDAGLKAFKRRRFGAAQADFQKAVDADPQNAAATFYLGYTYYKIAEPTRRLTAGKKRAAELFARAFELDPVFRPVWGTKG